MPLRWKLLLLLLAIALAPLAMMGVRAQRATTRLGDNIGAQARQALGARSEEQLRLFVAARAELLARDADVVRMIVELQASGAERLLAADPPPAAPVFFSADYRAAATAPPGLAQRPWHARVEADGGRTPFPVNTNGAVIHLAPGVDAQAAMPDVQRLARMLPVYRQAVRPHDDIAFWQYTALASGVFSCYPGSGSYPPEYDPRNRDWYAWAQEAGALRWTLPYIDAATGLAMMSCVKPIVGPDGTFAGVTGVDVTVDMLTRRGQLTGAHAAHAFIVIGVPHHTFTPFVTRAAFAETPPEDAGLFVLAAAPATPPNAHDEPRRRWLETNDTALQASFIERLYRDEAGVMRMPYQGADALWAFSRILRASAFLVAVVPYASVEAEAERAEATVTTLTNAQLKETAVIFLGVVVLVLGIALVGSRAVTTPVRNLAESARRIALGDLAAQVDVRSRDELGELGRAFNAMVPQLADRVRMRAALNVAMEVQQHLLPRAAPCIAGLDVAGHSRYCDETGGDYYDFLELARINDQTLGVAVGDVTGHGVAAALLMASGRALLRSHLDGADNLAHLISHMNRHLSADTVGGRFMTLCFLLVDAACRTLRWVSAGHDAPIVLDLANGAFRELEGGGLPLGVAEDWAYEEYTERMSDRGEVIVIGTDGIWEAANPAGEMYGKDRLRAAITACATLSAEGIAQGIAADLAAFCAAAPQADDITLVVIKTAPRPS